MLHFIEGNKHIYWEEKVYRKHLAEPCVSMWHPYYVCYIY